MRELLARQVPFHECSELPGGILLRLPLAKLNLEVSLEVSIGFVTADEFEGAFSFWASHQVAPIDPGNLFCSLQSCP